jgi:putative transposase
VRVRLPDPALRADLRNFLHRWGCVTYEVNDDAIEIIVPDAADQHQGRRELPRDLASTSPWSRADAPRLIRFDRGWVEGAPARFHRRASGAAPKPAPRFEWPICSGIVFVHPTGYKRIVGELKGVGVTISATSVRKALLEAGLQPAPRRTDSSWRAFLRAQASSMLACDFLTVETAFLQRIYVLSFISLATRRIEYVACTSNPAGGWVAQQARNLIMRFGDEQPFRFLIHDRDTKFSHAFDEVFRTEGIKMIRTPVQAPNANAHAERWVRTLRAECLDRILILCRRHLEHVLRVYRCHYNEHRPHRALDLFPPNGRDPTPLTAPDRLQRRDLLGGLIHEYQAAA